MKSIALTPHTGNTAQDVEIAQPVALGRDLLVKIEAVAVNPVDLLVRDQVLPGGGDQRVLGWDAAGTVVAAGPDVTLFQVGDPVFYAGSLVREGSYSEFQLVDERIAGRKPASLDFKHAAALPLTSITAWEGLFDRLGVSRHGADAGKRLLIIGGAGGVGSIAIQLAKQLGQLTVIATASRPESVRWVRALGADHVIDHGGDMAAQLLALGINDVDYVLSLNDTEQHFDAIAQVIAPQGKICAIVPSQAALPMEKVFAKSASWVWEMMFTRSMFGTPDMIEQHRLLNQVATLIDAGQLKSTLGESYGKINAANLGRAHAALESGRTIGKIVLAGF
jgi:zinc-binding alcohol dehydrogenase family protein